MASEPKPFVTGYPAAQHTNLPGPAATATAYPYPAPPYYAGVPQTGPSAVPYYDPRYNRTRFLRRLIVVVIAVFVLIGAATFILWLVLRPHLPEFSVSTASVSSLNVSSQQISYNFNVTLAVYNPNKKMGIYYDRINAAVLYGYDKLSETSLPPFYQGKRNGTELPARFAAVSEYVEYDVAKKIASDRANGGVLEFHVSLLSWVRFRSGAWRTRRHLMRVYCGNVRVGFSNASATVGSLVGSSNQCLVKL